MNQRLPRDATMISVLTFLILVVNFYYVMKFRESVDLQRKTAQGSLILQMNKDFFYREPHKKIIRRLEEHRLLREPTSGISDEELDDHIGFLGTVGALVRTGILDRELAANLLSHYFQSAYESPEIGEYLRKVQHNDPTLFLDFVWLYNQMKPISGR